MYLFSHSLLHLRQHLSTLSAETKIIFQLPLTVTTLVAEVTAQPAEKTVEINRYLLEGCKEKFCKEHASQQTLSLIALAVFVQRLLKFNKKS